MSALLADRRLYLTGDRGQVVEEGDVRAAFLLAAAGAWISADDVARYRLSHEAGRVVLAAPPTEATETKMAEPPEDKLLETGEDKMPKPKTIRFGGEDRE